MCFLKLKLLFLLTLCELLFKDQAQQIGCGVPRVREKDLIVRGQSATAHQWPWHATILHRKAFGKPPEYACGGSLISESFVLTARHCTLEDGSGHPLTASSVVVQFGVQRLYEVRANVQEHQVLRVHASKQFCCGELRNDIALLELRTVVQFNEFVLPVCLPEWEVMPGEFGTVVGFGLTEYDEVSQTLRKVQLPVIETGECLRSDRAGWGGILDEGLFCAGYLNGTAVCNGDSGGGLVFRKNDRWQIGGVVAFSLERDDEDGRCKHDGFGGFTKVWKYLKWIQHVTGLKPARRSDLSASISATSELPTECGKKTTKTDFPWLAVFYYYNDHFKHWSYYFGGSLITNRYILIEAIWWRDEWVESARYRVTFGDAVAGYVKDNYFSNLIFRDVGRSKVIRYQDDNSELLKIALMRLDPGVTFNEYVQPICLPAQDALEPAELVAIIIDEDKLFQYESAVRVDFNQCYVKCKSYKGLSESYLQSYVDTQLCIENEGQFRAGFPVGSFIQHSGGEKFTQYGLKSHNSCGNLSIHAKIAYYRNWIVDTIKK